MKENLRKKFIAACMESPPDYEYMVTALNEGFDINTENKPNYITGKSILSEVLLDRNRYSENEEDDISKEDNLYEYLELARFFIDNGFNVKKFGGDCMHYLCYSLSDEYVLDIAELLLDNGANINDKLDEEDNVVLDSIEWHLGDWVVGDARYANRMNAYYEMVDAVIKGEDYHGIRAFEYCIGKSITSVEKVAFTNEEKTFNDNNEHGFSGGLILWCDETPLLLTRYGEVYVDLRIENKEVYRKDVSETYSELVGKRIEDLYYIDGNQGIYLLSFEDSKTALLVNSVLTDKDKMRYSVSHVIDMCDKKNPDLWDVQEIYFSSGKRYSEIVQTYGEKYAVIKCRNTSYLIFSKGEDYKEHKFCIIDVKNWFNHGKLRRVKLKGPCFGECLARTSESIDGLVINTYDRQLIFTTDTFEEMKIVFVDKDRRDTEDINAIEGQYKLKFEEINMV